MSDYPNLLEQIQSIQQTHSSPFLIAFLVDLFDDLLEKKCNDPEDTLKKALEVGYCNEVHLEYIQPVCSRTCCHSSCLILCHNEEDPVF